MRTRSVLPATIALLAATLVSASAAETAKPTLASISYLVATAKEVVPVAPSVYATYIGSCLNRDARNPSIGPKRDAVYVCVVHPRTIAEMRDLKFISETVGYRAPAQP